MCVRMPLSSGSIAGVYIYEYIYMYIAFEPGASGLPYYCTPPVCVPDVIGALVVWRQNNNPKKRRM